MRTHRERVHRANRLRLLVYVQEIEADVYEKIRQEFPQIDFRIAVTAEEFKFLVSDADIVCMARKYARDMVLSGQRLKWLHVGGAGVDRLEPLSELDPKLIITNTPGITAEMMAEYVICVILMLAWDFPRLIRNQLEKKWEKWVIDEVQGRLVALIGLGNIGRAVAHKATALGMRVVGIKRSPESVPGVERVAGPNKLHQILSVADFIVLAVPLTEETRGMIGPNELDMIRRDAYLINVSRGEVIQEQALVEALQKQRIAGAALDVFVNEPLPPDSALWQLKNVILSPHISSESRHYRIRAAQSFRANLERYLSGEPLLNVIDRSRGY